MSLSRRTFVRTLGVAGAGAMTSSFIGARGREGLMGLWPAVETPVLAADRVILSSNENPLGPGQKVLDAVRAAFGPDGATPGRYPFGIAGEVTRAIAQKFGVKSDNVLIGCGSTQILRTVTQVHTSKTKALVGSIPTYEECAGYAELIGSPVKGVPMDKQFRLDLDATLAAAKGAGLVFYCNPNNPTATAVGGRATRDFIAQLNKTSPETTVLVDEAYADYVTDPSYESMIPLALENPRVIVARTFSKAYGMAGIRLGYAIGHPSAIRALAGWEGGGSINVLAMAAGIEAMKDQARIDQERDRNTAARDFTINWFAKAGYTCTDSQTNFLFVDVKRPAKGFRDACRQHGILVARDFPPFEKTHCRISIGTMDEMRRATEAFGKVLAAPATAAAA